MQDVGRRYVRLFNEAHERTGTLWEGRYKSSLVDTERYLLTCHRYIELNPVRARLVASPLHYRWSSHQHYALGARDPLITHHAIFDRLADDEAERRNGFLALFQEELDSATVERIRRTAKQGWALGSEEFLDRIEAALGRSARPPKRGRPSKDGNPKPASEDNASEMLI
jgi:putative transposase